MRWVRCAPNAGVLVIATLFFSFAPAAPGQADGQDRTQPPASKDDRPAQADPAVQAIDDAYNRQLVELGRRRLEQLAASPPAKSPPVPR